MTKQGAAYCNTLVLSIIPSIASLYLASSVGLRLRTSESKPIERTRVFQAYFPPLTRGYCSVLPNYSASYIFAVTHRAASLTNTLDHHYLITYHEPLSKSPTHHTLLLGNRETNNKQSPGRLLHHGRLVAQNLNRPATHWNR